MNTGSDLSALQALRTRIMVALRQVIDPEIGENIVDLGLVQRLELSLQPPLAALVLLPTSATCPMADLIMDEAGCATRVQCPPDWRVEVEMDWQGQWTPERMAPALRARLGWGAPTP